LFFASKISKTFLLKIMKKQTKIILVLQHFHHKKSISLPS
jgi:hypothetical protein